MSNKRPKSPASNKSTPKSLPPTVPPIIAKTGAAGLLASLVDGVLVYDRAGELVYYNQAASDLMNWAAAGVDPRTRSFAERAALYEIYDIDGRPTTLTFENVAEALAGKVAQAHGWRLHRADGTIVYVHSQASTLRDEATGDVVGAIIIVRDMTPWGAANDTKEAFIGIASHELRAPLQPLIFASRFIQRWIDRTEHVEDLRELAEEIVRQSKRMARLVQDMLDMTRITSGHFTLDPAVCDIAAVVRNVAEEQQRATQRAVIVIGADDPLMATADAERLWQVLTNLVANAIKFSMAPAPVTLTLTTFAEADAPWLRIAVQDQGFGIAAKDVPYLFDRFYQPSAPATRQHRDGLGLGLYITHGIVTAHGGRIGVTSTLNRGSTFTVEIPFPTSGEEGD